MKLKIAVAGSNRMNAEEVVDAMRLILGNMVREATVVQTGEITDVRMADLFVCATTQAAELARRVPPQKMVVLDLQPTTQFFVEVARIPAGETVVVFNSNSRYAECLVDSCRRVGIKELDFRLLGYEEMAPAEVAAVLREARHIIGIDRQVGEDILLSPPYAGSLRSDVHIIGIQRVASMQSACRLIQWVASYLHQAVARQVSLITNRLRTAVIRNHDGSGAGDLAGVANELDRLLTESNQSILTMHDAVMKSFANQIAPHITMVDKEPRCGSEGSANQEIVQTLENISSLSEKCLRLEKKLDALE